MLSNLFEIEKEIKLTKQNLVENLFRSRSSEIDKTTRNKLIELNRQVNSFEINMGFHFQHINVGFDTESINKLQNLADQYKELEKSVDEEFSLLEIKNREGFKELIKIDNDLIEWNYISLLGGFEIMWTGMKVLKHDGSQHHLIGVQPTYPVKRTIKQLKRVETSI